MKTAWSARNQPRTITNADSRRVARPIVIVTKWPQSVWPCSPTNRLSRGYASSAGAGRSVRTTRRSWTTERGYLRARTISKSRVAAEPGVLLEGRLEERAVQVKQTGPDDGRAGEPLHDQRPADRVGVQAELVGDGPHPPMLGQEEAADLPDLRREDHGRPRSPEYPPSLPRPAGRPGGPLARAVLAPSDEPAPAAARPPTGPGIRGRINGGGRLPWSPGIEASWPAGKADQGRRRERGPPEDAAAGGLGGRVMRHARATPGLVRSLPITVIEAALAALLVPFAGRAETAGAPFPWVIPDGSVWATPGGSPQATADRRLDVGRRPGSGFLGMRKADFP